MSRSGLPPDELWNRFEKKFGRPPRQPQDLVNFSKKIPNNKPIALGKARQYFEKMSSGGGASASKAKFAIDDSVLLTKDRYGTVKFVGVTGFGDGLWYGVVLSRGYVGDTNGTREGRVYFECADNRGIFCRQDSIRRKMTKRDHQRREQFTPDIERSLRAPTQAPTGDVNVAADGDDEKESNVVESADGTLVLAENAAEEKRDAAPRLRPARCLEVKDARLNPFARKKDDNETENLSWHDWPQRANEVAQNGGYAPLTDTVISTLYKDANTKWPLEGTHINRMDPEEFVSILGPDCSYPISFWQVNNNLRGFSSVADMDVARFEPATGYGTCLIPIVIFVNDHIHGWFYPTKIQGDLYAKSIQPGGLLKEISQRGIVQHDRGPNNYARVSIGEKVTYQINDRLYLAIEPKDEGRTVAAGLLCADECQMENVVVMPIAKFDHGEIDLKVMRQDNSDDMQGIRVDVYRWIPVRVEEDKKSKKKGVSLQWKKELLLHYQTEGSLSSAMLTRQVLGRGEVNTQELELNDECLEAATDEEITFVVGCLSQRSWDPKVILPLLKFLEARWQHRPVFHESLALDLSTGAFHFVKAYFIDKETGAALPLLVEMLPHFAKNNCLHNLAKSNQLNIFHALLDIRDEENPDFPNPVPKWLLEKDEDGLTPIHHCTDPAMANAMLDALLYVNTDYPTMVALSQIRYTNRDTLVHVFSRKGWAQVVDRFMALGVEVQSLQLERNFDKMIPFELPQMQTQLVSKFYSVFTRIEPSVRDKFKEYWKKKLPTLRDDEVASNPLSVIVKPEKKKPKEDKKKRKGGRTTSRATSRGTSRATNRGNAYF